MAAKVLMVQGTASSVGKSLLVTALCRVFRQDGYRVAPFKAQNMSLNSAVTPGGLEIGRAQAVQAEAAGIEATADMNPVLLKPEAESRSQVVVLGRPSATLAARDYYARKAALWDVVVGALDRLRAAHDLIVVEGAGSPAEVNLRATDISNMRVALHAGAPVLLVGDIDCGGVFAALVGTLALLEPEEQALVRGLIINKFRGDRGLLEPGLEFLARRTGKPVLGVLPYLRHLRIAAEDSAALGRETDTVPGGPLDVAVVRLPGSRTSTISICSPPNLRCACGTWTGPRRWGRPTSSSFRAANRPSPTSSLRETGLADGVVARARGGTPVLGICGGYQMLGERLRDPLGVESPTAETPGLGLLPARTTFVPEKRTRRVRARAATGRGSWGGCGARPWTATRSTWGSPRRTARPCFTSRPPARRSGRTAASARAGWSPGRTCTACSSRPRRGRP